MFCVWYIAELTLVWLMLFSLVVKTNVGFSFGVINILFVDNVDILISDGAYYRQFILNILY